MKNPCLRIRALTLALAASFAAPGIALADDLALAFTVEGTGLAVAEDGIVPSGQRGRRTFPDPFQVFIGGTVQKAMLYWGGFMNNPAAPPGDQFLNFSGTVFDGALIGTEIIDNGVTSNLAFCRAADVTARVLTDFDGIHSYNFFIVDDGLVANNADVLSGLGLFIIYEDAADTASYQIQGFHGCDFAFNEAPYLPTNRVTIPVTISYASAAANRVADLWVFGGGGEVGRPDQLTITDNLTYEDPFDSTDGPSWDTDPFLIDIPALASSTTVHAVSSSPSAVSPDSFIVAFNALRLTPPPPDTPDDEESEVPDDEVPDVPDDEGSDVPDDEGSDDEQSDIFDKFNKNKNKKGGWF